MPRFQSFNAIFSMMDRARFKFMVLFCDISYKNLSREDFGCLDLCLCKLVEKKCQIQKFCFGFCGSRLASSTKEKIILGFFGDITVDGYSLQPWDFMNNHCFHLCLALMIIRHSETHL